MAEPQSNYSEVERALDELTHGINFTSKGQGQALARDLSKIVAEGIRDRSIPPNPGRSPDGEVWPDNADNPKGKGYKSWKAKHDVDNVGVGVKRDAIATRIPGVVLAARGMGNSADKPSGGDMLSDVNLTGDVTIEPELIQITYGAPGADWSRRKAQFFTNGSVPSSDGTEHSGAKNQPPRPFWGLDEEINAKCEERIDVFLDDLLGTL
jgi:hypothetical protein